MFRHKISTHVFISQWIITQVRKSICMCACPANTEKRGIVRKSALKTNKLHQAKLFGLIKLERNLPGDCQFVNLLGYLKCHMATISGHLLSFLLISSTFIDR